ncbi:TPA: restriction endonuclease subunit S [Escherichia coli]|nr:restriction endonuclease subunit S [Escherichia coli]HDV2698873.1 restriction endonuclease subunit S [Escherichia coli]HDV2735945.1 restriction endonuclease subunit S [Escherichia coli]HDV3322045.1 restriction endonuclease subunit S [Escherichia coli]HDV3332265.1 restriction endonuclease subunit S [Escherichia coli]
MSKNWQICQLGDVLTLINGRAYKKEEMLTEGVPILRIQNLNGGNKWFYSNLELQEDKYCYKNDLLYAWSATFGPYWSKWDHKLIYHYHIWKIETSPALNKQFAYYALLNITEALKASAHGVAMPHITKAGMEAWEIQLPPISEQKIIAEKLDTLLAQVESTKARLEQIPQILKRFRQAVLGAAVSGKLTEDWRDNSSLSGWIEGKLGEFIKKPSYGTSSKSNKEGLIPVLRMGNLQGGKLDWTDLVYTSDTIEIEKYKLEYNDVLFNRTNSPELVGKTAIYKSEQPAIYAGYLIRVQCLPDLNPDYLNYHLNSILGRQYCYSVKSDGVSQSNINAQKLIAYPITVPPLPEQHEIVRRVEQLFAYADTIEKQVNNALARVNNLTQSILAKAFRGELTAQWRAENPELISGVNSAAALLEKIKAERAASGGKKASRKKS